MKKTPTIKDIAHEVGVSETTISRYLNGKYEYMSEKTKKKIEEIIKEMNYRPNHMARTLKSQKSKMIGAVIADISNPFSSITIKGLSDRCEELGYTLLISVSDDSKNKETKQIKRLIANQVDGLIINTTGNNEVYLGELVKTKLPIVLLDRGIKNNIIDTVTTNNYEAVKEMILFLIKQGFCSIAFFVDKLSNTVRNDRLRAFEDVVEEEGKINSRIYSIPNLDKEVVTKSIYEFYSTPGPRVIFGANGLVTTVILEVLSDEDFIINKDFGICGFDDLSWSKVIKPELTTIHQDSYELGREAMSQLIKKIENKELNDEPSKVTLFPATLNIRESTKI